MHHLPLLGSHTGSYSGQLARALWHQTCNLLLLACLSVPVREGAERLVQVAEVPRDPENAEEVGSGESDVWPHQPRVPDDAG